MRSLLATALVALVLAGCGEDETSQPAGPAPQEAVHELPDLPRGWKAYRNRVGGFWLGRPPGWSANLRGTTTVLKAPNELVAVTVSADRTDDAVAIDPEQFALRVISALPGFEGKVDPSEPRRFRHRYAGVEVRGTATASATGVRQRLRVVVLRRGRLAVVTAVVAENARRGTGEEVEQALRAVRTLRTRPVG